MADQKHIIPQKHSIQRSDREKLHGHKSALLWFTGLSGSGKSTISQELDLLLFNRKIHSYVLDGDNIRGGLNSDLGFSNTDRKENIRRIAEVAKLFVESGLIVSTAFISPFKSERDFARSLLPEGSFVEIFVDCPLEECERRDVKGLYKKARNGEIPMFTGIHSPYEPPQNPELHIQTRENSISESAEMIISYLEKSGIIKK